MAIASLRRSAQRSLQTAPARDILPFSAFFPLLPLLFTAVPKREKNGTENINIKRFTNRHPNSITPPNPPLQPATAQGTHKSCLAQPHVLEKERGLLVRPHLLFSPRMNPSTEPRNHNKPPSRADLAGSEHAPAPGPASQPMGARSDPHQGGWLGPTLFVYQQCCRCVFALPRRLVVWPSLAQCRGSPSLRVPELFIADARLLSSSWTSWWCWPVSSVERLPLVLPSPFPLCFFLLFLSFSSSFSSSPQSSLCSKRKHSPFARKSSAYSEKEDRNLSLQHQITPTQTRLRYRLD